MTQDQPEQPRRNGRPTDCTPELVETIAAYITGGMTQREASIRAGIDETTYRRWHNQGQQWTEAWALHHDNPDEHPQPNPDDHSPNIEAYAHFYQSITVARANAEGLFIGAIRKAATNDDWKAAAWWLERSIPERWGKREHHTLAGDPNQPIVIDLQFDDPPDDEERPAQPA